MNFDETYLSVDLDALDANFSAIRSKANNKIMAVVKADAYGHGAVVLAKHLESRSDFFGVACVSEALELRKAGIRLPILILGHTPVQAFGQVIAHEIRPAIFRMDEAVEFSKEAVRQGVKAPIHIALDTGMGRIGFSADPDGMEQVLAISNMEGITIEGLFSHYACADMEDLAPTNAQMARFDGFVEQLEARGVTVPLCHLSNSAGLMRLSSQHNMVRTGIVLYGLYPDAQMDRSLLPLQPVVSWHSCITMLKTLPAGSPVSYGATYITTKPTRVATVPVGYADGYPRSLSGKFHVLICGKKAPILGRVCMDQMMVDVTDIPEAEEGTAVTLIGKDGQQSISVEDVSNCSGVFHYELVCGFGRRQPRLYTQGGKVVQSLHYLQK